MKRIPGFLGACLLALVAFGISSSGESATERPIRVVYHLSEGIDQAAHAMANIRNHLAADPTVRIVVVGEGAGIDFMLDGAKDKNGNPFDATIQDLMSQGVKFRACNNTLIARQLSRSSVIEDVKIVPAGLAEIARLEAREGYAYIHP
jgi:intracellular sulfur oxidation DsrE/DsrF family protein